MVMDVTLDRMVNVILHWLVKGGALCVIIVDVALQIAHYVHWVFHLNKCCHTHQLHGTNLFS